MIWPKLDDGTTDRDVGLYDCMVILAAMGQDFAEGLRRMTAAALGNEKPYKPYQDRIKSAGLRGRSKELYGLKGPVDLVKKRPYLERCRECMAASLRGWPT
ncbi:MAG: hypothetical protein B9J98_02300 [Candidatus Terraquivivens tikiterensis]|uniref:Uncharacterized protein n=1 Tax=Candidatus Terraquivivens tikiterensis TaxID=1980982 RepID=A0A2R7Y8B4_9ARCH|nr:MAG: hypothetical protein B9J98_02300 [Candidatus Terraquivivens tikiterensis]